MYGMSKKILSSPGPTKDIFFYLSYTFHQVPKREGVCVRERERKHSHVKREMEELQDDRGKWQSLFKSTIKG